MHTEVEGNNFCSDFEIILDHARDLGYSIRRVCDIAEAIDKKALPVRPLKMGWIHNRAFKCAV
ncbi:hypothetical protein EG829_18610 [bacterium]|nr:hypothetical protein [bacterium]